MIRVTPFADLGRSDRDWLSARFHFSFAEYHDPDRMGFGPLRVWNDDLFRPGGGFPMHPHQDFEIITYVRKGAVTHGDSLGNQGVTRAGQVQVMSAGTGIVHSEHNQGDEDLELFQIWIRPDRPGLPPHWQTRESARAGAGLELLASGRDGHGGDGVLPIHQDAALYAADMNDGETVTHSLTAGRRAYLVPARGSVTVNGVAVSTRAGAAIEGEDRLTITADGDAEVVLLDLP